MIIRSKTSFCLCRWDSPLINLQLDDTLPAEEIRKAIFEVAAPLPNQSTINVRETFIDCLLFYCIKFKYDLTILKYLNFLLKMYTYIH